MGEKFFTSANRNRRVVALAHAPAKWHLEGCVSCISLEISSIHVRGDGMSRRSCSQCVSRARMRRVRGLFTGTSRDEFR
jgi:hypothetical protein